MFDPYYEPKFLLYMYGYKKGKNTFQVVGFLKSVLQKLNLKHFGAIIIDIEKCIDNLSHKAILTYFNILNK